MFPSCDRNKLLDLPLELDLVRLVQLHLSERESRLQVQAACALCEKPALGALVSIAEYGWKRTSLKNCRTQAVAREEASRGKTAVATSSSSCQSAEGVGPSRREGECALHAAALDSIPEQPLSTAGCSQKQHPSAGQVSGLQPDSAAHSTLQHCRWGSGRSLWLHFPNPLQVGPLQSLELGSTISFLTGSAGPGQASRGSTPSTARSNLCATLCQDWPPQVCPPQRGGGQQQQLWPLGRDCQ